VSDVESIADIYDAVGDVNRWQHLNDRLARAGPPSTEVAWHLAIGRRAHEQHVRLNEELAAFLSVHDQLTLGVIVLDGEGRILAANIVAARHLADAGALTRHGDRVQAVAVSEHSALSNAIKEASSQEAPRNPFVVLTRERRSPLSVVVVRAGRQAERAPNESRSVALLLIDPDLRTPPGTDVLRALFGFTTREAELAAILMNGCSLEEAAHALGIAITTARTFLAHITAKTDSHSQPELMQRLLAIPHVT